VLNDATLEDAVRVGLNELCAVVPNGERIPGFLPHEGDGRFLKLFRESPVILAKGVGNFECAPFDDERMFFLFMVKCQTLSKGLNLPLNTLVFRQGRGSLIR
jgi:uncharacterized protein with ATP-grasp and redox domains